ncbi:MAG: hypothetical protein KAR17_21555, partial [Cyclobacteriaceae bacterium]|nr:hypothetical protein [Cyclobacteriaceae bacterium]
MDRIFLNKIIKDKFKSVLNSWKFRQVLIRMLWMIATWVVALKIFVILRFSGNPNAANPIDPSAPIDISILFLNVLRGGIILGIAFGLLDLIFERRVFKVMSYGQLILIKSVFYIILFVLTSFITNLISFTIYHGYVDFDLWVKNISRLPWRVPLFYVS